MSTEISCFETKVRGGFPVMVRILGYMPAERAVVGKDPLRCEPPQLAQIKIEVENMNGEKAGFLRLSEFELEALENQAIKHMEDYHG